MSPLKRFDCNTHPPLPHLQPYFCSYHTLATVLLRRLEASKKTFIAYCGLIAALAYSTAFMETWSIAAFPHYVRASVTRTLCACEGGRMRAHSRMDLERAEREGNMDRVCLCVCVCVCAL